MNGKIFRRCNCLLLVAGLLLFAIPLAQASDPSRLSGTYRVVEKSNLGSQVRVRLQLHITNHGRRELHIERMALWDFSHASKGGTQACSIVVRAGGSADSTQEFTIPRAQYEMWRRGTQPRLVLQEQTPGGRTTQAVRLTRVPGGKAD